MRMAFLMAGIIGYIPEIKVTKSWNLTVSRLTGIRPALT
jgi:hypothetical protein